eukprot:scaffold7676_cov258-Pinguiococcus_pyrenoidosus.AAC.6
MQGTPSTEAKFRKLSTRTTSSGTTCRAATFSMARLSRTLTFSRAMPVKHGQSWKVSPKDGTCGEGAWQRQDYLVVVYGSPPTCRSITPRAESKVQHQKEEGAKVKEASVVGLSRPGAHQGRLVGAWTS